MAYKKATMSNCNSRVHRDHEVKGASGWHSCAWWVRKIAMTLFMAICFISCPHPTSNPSADEEPPPIWNYVVSSSPTDGGITLDQSPKVSWSVDSPASSYKFRIGDTEADLESALAVELSSAEFQWVAAGIAFATVKYWQFCFSNGGSYSNWSPSYDFTVSDTAGPILSSPANNATPVASQPEFSWQGVAGAIKYRLEVTGQGIIWPISDTSETVYYTWSTPLAAGTYTWRVQAANDSVPPGFSQWSGYFTFTVP